MTEKGAKQLCSNHVVVGYVHKVKMSERGYEHNLTVGYMGIIICWRNGQKNFIGYMTINKLSEKGVVGGVEMSEK